MIELSKLSETDVGVWVEYRDTFDSKPDRGRIRSWNDEFIYVVYRCGGNWDEFGKYTGVATDPGDLSYIGGVEQLKNIVAATEVERDAADQVCENLREELKSLKEESEILTGVVKELGAICRNKNRLITELADALEEEFGESRDLMQSQQHPWNLIRQGREATK